MNAREYAVMYQVEDEHWWYRGIHRLITSTLARHHADQGQPGWRILDAGCGTGALAPKLKQFGQVQAIDLSSLALYFSKRRGLGSRLGQASVTELPVVANAFDIITSVDVLCTVPDDDLALHEFWRTLKPQGLLIMNLPALKWLKGQHDIAVSIVRRYTYSELTDKLLRHGFRIEQMSFANGLLFPLVAPYRLATRLGSTDRAEPQSDVFLPALPVNTMLGWIMGLESYLIPHMKLPIGMSLFVVAKKIV